MSGQHCENYGVKRETVTVTREMLTAVARDRKWPVVVAGISARFSKFAFVFFCYITNHLMTGPLVLVSLDSHCFPRLRLGKH